MAPATNAGEELACAALAQYQTRLQSAQRKARHGSGGQGSVSGDAHRIAARLPGEHECHRIGWPGDYAAHNLPLAKNGIEVATVSPCNGLPFTIP